MGAERFLRKIDLIASLQPPHMPPWCAAIRLPITTV
jgi:hypothetical protein